MSPEQATASTKLDHRCDLWALATIAYEALTGELPVAGDDTDTILRNVCAGRIIPVLQRDPYLPSGLDAFFARAFAEDVGARYQSATELAQAFVLAMGTAGVAVQASPVEQGPQRAPESGRGERTPVDDVGGVETGVTGLRKRVRTRIAFVAAGLAAAVVGVLGALGVASRAPASAGTAVVASTPGAASTPGQGASAPAGATGTPGAPGTPAPAFAPAVTPVASSVVVPLPSVTIAAPAIPVTALPHAHARPPVTRGGGSPQGKSPAAPDGTPAPAPPPSQPKKVDKSEVL
jgi:serine/threonine-protein kinase